MKATDTGLRRILKAFTYSYDGFISAFKSEAALRQDILFGLTFVWLACLGGAAGIDGFFPHLYHICRIGEYGRGGCRG